jgi:hypothetical protein
MALPPLLGRGGHAAKAARTPDPDRRGGRLLRRLRIRALRPNLHFHHVDPATKTFPMSSGIGRSLARFREEAAKCVLVCANCHGEIEAGLIESPPVAAKYDNRRAA